MLSSLSSTIKTVLLIGCLPRIVYRPARAIFSQLIQYFVASPSSPAKPFDSDNPPRAHVRRTRSVRPSRTGCRPAGGTRSPPGPAAADRRRRRGAVLLHARAGGLPDRAGTLLRLALLCPLRQHPPPGRRQPGRRPDNPRLGH